MDENDPVDDGEFVYRRIHPTFYDPSQPIPVRLLAFRPSEQDAAGLSVLRAQFARPQDVLANRDPAKMAGYYVARLAVRQLRALGLSVIPDPIPGGPAGHAVIPELACDSYQNNKKQWKPVLTELAKLASADIVLGPT